MFMRLSVVLIVFTGAVNVFAQDSPAVAKVGDEAPELAIEKLFHAPAGAEAKLAKLRGKAVVLEFWATWCGPCVAAIPHWNEVVEKYKDKPIQFISITDEKVKLIRKFNKKKKMLGWSAVDTDSSVFKAYGIRGRPTTVLIDKEGKIRAFTHPSLLFDKHLDELTSGKPLSLAPLDDRQPPEPKRTGGDDLAPAIFEVTIRPAEKSHGCMSSGLGNVRFDGHALPFVVAWAYDVPHTRLVDRAGLPVEEYDIEVKVPAKRHSSMRGLLQDALETAFDFRARREAQKQDVYFLSVTSGGVKEGLQATVSSHGSSSGSGRGRYYAVNLPISSLTGNVEFALGRPVLDRTGLSENYDYELKVEDDTLEAFQTALRDQLGLELKEGQAPVEMLIIKHVPQAPRMAD